MKDALQGQYNIRLGREIQRNGLTGFENSDGIYYLLPVQNFSDETAYEQRSICEYLKSSGLQQVALPMFTTEGRLYTTIQHQDYMLVHTDYSPPSNQDQGAELAKLHQLGNEYPYQPQHISRYGHWKKLWEDKMDTWTEIYKKEWEERPSSTYQRLFIETFPYLEGITENAIQYLQESEQDWRYEHFDQGTFTFERLHTSMLSENVWPHTLVYDHPARDLAEMMRYNFLENGMRGFDNIIRFMDSYESVRPLSVFSWRMIYARLLLPVHLFDALESSIAKDQKRNVAAEKYYRKLLTNQSTYEKILHRFFIELSLDAKRNHIPVLDWE